MGRLLFQFLVISGTFLGSWFILGRINYTDIAWIQNVYHKNEQKLGNLIIENLAGESTEIKSPLLSTVIDSLGTRICDSSGLDFTKYKVCVFKKDEINAFAVPGNRIVIFSGLINYCVNPEELTGIMAHEIGHIEKKHLMKKLTKELGIAALFNIAGKQAGTEVMKETSRVLSSTAFDRKQEEEADEYSVNLMKKSGIDPVNLAGFLTRLSNDKNTLPEELVWFSTHPDSKERARRILARKTERPFRPVPLIKTPWENVKELIKIQ
jgi:predicted Zn-dependent protease